MNTMTKDDHLSAVWIIDVILEAIDLNIMIDTKTLNTNPSKTVLQLMREHHKLLSVTETN